jgi:hypothetical protein
MKLPDHLDAARALLIAEIEAYCRSRDIGETTFGKLALNDAKFVARLRSGGNLTLRTMARAHAYIRRAHSEPASADG